MTKTATLKLKHDHPVHNPPKTAHVSIEHVLETIKYESVDVGSWINVIGYIERVQGNRIYVQAVSVWDAGNVNLEAYQQAVNARTDVG